MAMTAAKPWLAHYEPGVPAEINPNEYPSLVDLLDREKLAAIDLFDRVQLAEVIRVCRNSDSLSAAGRTLFAASRAAKSHPNDADRLRKYLARFDLAWNEIRNSAKSAGSG